MLLVCVCATAIYVVAQDIAPLSNIPVDGPGPREKSSLHNAAECVARIACATGVGLVKGSVKGGVRGALYGTAAGTVLAPGPGTAAGAAAGSLFGAGYGGVVGGIKGAAHQIGREVSYQYSRYDKENNDKQHQQHSQANRQSQPLNPKIRHQPIFRKFGTVQQRQKQERKTGSPTFLSSSKVAPNPVVERKRRPEGESRESEDGERTNVQIKEEFDDNVEKYYRAMGVGLIDPATGKEITEEDVDKATSMGQAGLSNTGPDTPKTSGTGHAGPSSNESGVREDRQDDKNDGRGDIGNEHRYDGGSFGHDSHRDHFDRIDRHDWHHW